MLRLLHRVLFEKYPNLGTSVIYGSLNAIADICAQLFFSSGSFYNPYRTLRFLLFGMGIAPLAVMWNTYLERTYPLRPSVEDPLALPVQLEGITIDKMREVSSPRVHRRVAMDQIVMAPISFIVFLVCMGMMEFLTPSEIYLKVENALWPILLTNWKVWPFVQAVMFLYVPLVYRVPLSGVVNLVWTIFLSWETARSAMA